VRVAIIQCPVWGTYDPPVALAQLSSCLKHEGYEVFVFDLNIKLYLSRKESYKNMWAWEQSSFWYNEKQINNFFKDNKDDIENYIEDIANTGARIVGFSVNSASRLFSIEIAKRLKEKNKRLMIIFGGPLFFEKRFIDSVLNNNAVDMVIPKEGEVTFCELVKLIDENQDISSCNGISFKMDGRVVNTAPRKSLIKLDNLPFLDFEDLPLSDYDDSRHIPFMASRGCIQRCVFCSSRVFWPGYRTMSGERIFKEIKFHKIQQSKLNNNFAHVDFLDLLFNGNMRTLTDFCDLMRKSELDIHWTANMIIRPEMDLNIIKKMKESGCEHIIFGIESGSQRVLDLMNKNYQIEDANRIIKCLHEAGIVVTCNFMFGFPGETDEDFQMTLDFIERNSKFLDRVYPSRTFFAIEEYSYLHSHLEEFSIKPNPPNHLYWQSLDGKNTYPVRLERCEEFCNLASYLGIEVGCGVQTSVEQDKLYNLAFYYEKIEDYHKAIDYFLKYYKLDPANKSISNKINSYYSALKENNIDLSHNSSLFVGLKEVAVNMKNIKNNILVQPAVRVETKQNPALQKQYQKDNSDLNDKEFESGKIILKSYPKSFFLQVAGPCNSNCVFCSRETDYDFFNLDIHRERFEDKLNVFLSKAERIILTGSGEFLLLPEAESILGYFDDNFSQVEKMFSTNGSSLTPSICEKIVNSKSKYTIHISLHSSSSNTHEVLTKSNNFHKIVGQLNYLLKLKKNASNNPILNLVFVATTLNIKNLPQFVKFAASLGIDKVICYYNYIYTHSQKKLSCFFKQRLTNDMLDKAENIAHELNIKIDLPPRFGLKDYPITDLCREPWSQIMINSQGHILPCDASEDTNESLEGRNFWEIWNGEYYQGLRKSLIEGSCSCFKHCFRANPASVNDFKSHVIHRGIKGSEINILCGDNF